MLRQWMGWILCAALGLTAAGCSGADTEVMADGRMSVVASFATMADFAGKIGGDRVEVRALVPAGAEPHDWEPSAQDIARLESADMLALNGAGFEHWTESVLSTLKNEALVVVDTSDGVDLREGHDHGDDPHIWLDPANVKLQMAAIRDAMTAIDPEGEADYGANYDRWAEELDKLDAEYRGAISVVPGREIVVAHEAFGYLCGAYGLTQIAAQGLSPEGEPDPAQMAEVIVLSKERNVKVIFFEDTASPKVAEAIAREIGAETAVLSPLETLPEGGDYFSAMRDNLEQLKKALA